jgi:hypothetical protein
VKKFFLRIGYFFSFGLRLYLVWSHIFRWLWHWRYRWVALDGYLSPELARDKMRLLRWTKDGPRALWDALGSPQWVQYCINEREEGKVQPEGYLDCDEFAVWAASVLDRNLAPCVMNVRWVGGGHHVCFFIRGGKCFHISNWGLSPAFDHVDEVVSDVLKGRELVGWSTFSPDLRLGSVRWHFRLT